MLSVDVVIFHFAFFNDLLRNRCGSLLISCKFKREITSACGDAAERYREIAHFSHGNFGFEKLHLRLVGGAHAEHSAAALCDVAHDVTEIIVGHVGFKSADGFEDCGVCGVLELLERKRRRSFERHFGGVDGVIRAVVEHRLDADYGITRNDTSRYAIAKTLFDCREEVLGHGTAYNFFFKDKIAFAVRLETNPHVAELTVSAGLFFMSAVNLHGFLYRFSVSDTRRCEGNFNTEFRFKLVDDEVKVLLAES